jgi:D-hexose-6-phosphate mutarotase
VNSLFFVLCFFYTDLQKHFRLEVLLLLLLLLLTILLFAFKLNNEPKKTIQFTVLFSHYFSVREIELTTLKTKKITFQNNTKIVEDDTTFHQRLESIHNTQFSNC